MKEERVESGGRIVRLRPEVIAKIAAGEMILRPLSVAKELLENACDAGASRIEFRITDAADRFISCADDGCGMTAEECRLAVESHTTSKLREEDDLLTVETLGFRGEALASIARIAQLKIVTSPGDGEGTEIRIRGGHVEWVRPAARARGTTVEVEDLFFNSPVRKRVLRSPVGEIRLIQKLISSYGLVRPALDLRLVVDGKESLHLPAAEAVERLEQVYGPRFREKLIPLEGDHPRIRVRGWIGIPEISRATGAAQTIIVNGRWVSHPGLSHALRQGFGDLIPPMRQPFAVLLLDVAAGSVDVNIHPTKREIRFIDENAVFAETMRVVRGAVHRLVPGLATAGGDPTRWSSSGHPSGGSANADGLGLLYAPSAPPHPRVSDGAASPSAGEAAAPQPAPPVQLWQVQERYIVAQTRQGILIVDQHAAHERVLYERALAWLAGDHATSQELLFPVLVHLPPGDFAILESLIEELPRLGIHVERFGEGTVIVRAVPPTWEGDPEAMLKDLLDDVAERTARREARDQALAASFACHSAIRSGTKLDLESMNRLIDELFATSVPHGDPHGRPTYVVLTTEDLDRRFGRG